MRTWGIELETNYRVCNTRCREFPEKEILMEISSENSQDIKLQVTSDTGKHMVRVSRDQFPANRDGEAQTNICELIVGVGSENFPDSTQIILSLVEATLHTFLKDKQFYNASGQNRPYCKYAKKDFDIVINNVSYHVTVKQEFYLFYIIDPHATRNEPEEFPTPEKLKISSCHMTLGYGNQDKLEVKSGANHRELPISDYSRFYEFISQHNNTADLNKTLFALPFSVTAYDIWIAMLDCKYNAVTNRKYNDSLKPTKEISIIKSFDTLWSCIEWVRFFIGMSLTDRRPNTLGIKVYFDVMSRLELLPSLVYIKDLLSVLFPEQNLGRNDGERDSIISTCLEYVNYSLLSFVPFKQGFVGPLVGTMSENTSKKVIFESFHNFYTIKNLLIMFLGSSQKDDLVTKTLSEYDKQKEALYVLADLYHDKYEEKGDLPREKFDKMFREAKDNIKSMDWMSPPLYCDNEDPLGYYSRHNMNQHKQLIIVELRKPNVYEKEGHTYWGTMKGKIEDILKKYNNF